MIVIPRFNKTIIYSILAFIVNLENSKLEWKEIKNADLRRLKDDKMNKKHKEQRKKQAEKLANKGKGNALNGPGTGVTESSLAFGNVLGGIQICQLGEHSLYFSVVD